MFDIPVNSLYPLLLLLALILLIFILLKRNRKTNSELLRRPEEIVALESRTQPVEVNNDTALIKRILEAYQRACKKHLGKSMWQIFFDKRHKSIHQIFQEGQMDAATHILRNPGGSDLFYGFDNLAISILPSFSKASARQSHAVHCLDYLMRFGEAIGAIPLHNPANYDTARLKRWDGASIVAKIEETLNITLNFPNPYADELGAWTPRGILSYRVIQSLYQAWLIKQLLKGIDHPRVLEIGAGLGRTAYYANLLGIEDYTIIDIPMTTVSSAYFLGRTLGEEKVLLLGEQTDDAKKRIKILTPEPFLNGNESYDLIINVDSLTELDPQVAQAYINRITASTPLFLSINHEANPFTVKQLIDQCPNVKDVQRKLYWMRPGYVEEIIRFT